MPSAFPSLVSRVRRARAAASLRARAGALPARAAFTLLETMLALIIIGVGILAFIDAQAAFTTSNNWSSQAGTAMLLANEIREMTRRLPRHDPVTGLWIDAANGNALRGWGRETGEVLPADIDDIDDLDGISFGATGIMGGPVDAFGDVVPAVGLDGTIITTGSPGTMTPRQIIRSGIARTLEGWTQRVTVDKVDPYNFSTVRADNYARASSAQLPAIPVDSFPLKVTVIVEHQGVNDAGPREITRVSWVVPPQ